VNQKAQKRGVIEKRKSVFTSMVAVFHLAGATAACNYQGKNWRERVDRGHAVGRQI